METGFSEEEIAQACMARGWTRRDVFEAIKLLSQERSKPLSSEEKLAPKERQEAQAPPGKTVVVSRGGFSSTAAWLSCIWRPAATLRAAKYFASVYRAFFSLVLPYIVVAVATATGVILFANELAKALPPEISGPVMAFGTLATAGLTVGAIAGPLIQVILANCIVWLFARLFGGKGGLIDQLYLSSIAFGASFLLLLFGGAIVLVSGLLPAGSVPEFVFGNYSLSVFSVLALVYYGLVLLYSVWLHLSAVKHAHEFGYGSALLAIIIPALIAGVITGALASTVLSGFVFNTNSSLVPGFNATLG